MFSYYRTCSLTIGLCNDLDNMVRTLERTVYKDRISFGDEQITNASAALHNLAWYHAVAAVVDHHEGGSEWTGFRSSPPSADDVDKAIADAEDD